MGWYRDDEKVVCAELGDLSFEMCVCHDIGSHHVYAPQDAPVWDRAGCNRHNERDQWKAIPQHRQMGRIANFLNSNAETFRAASSHICS